MPIRIPDKLPAKEILQCENIFVMDESRAYRQDIRALEIAIVNLMPIKQVTEVQLLRLLGNSPLQVNLTFLHMASHFSKNTGADHLLDFYLTFPEIKDRRFDGMIITGAPVETLPFEEVNYWSELADIMSWSLNNVTSVLHICWGAQAGLYYHYGIPKYPLENKKFGIFPHTMKKTETKTETETKIVNIKETKTEKKIQNFEILRGFDDVFYVPQSRHTEVRREDILKRSDLVILSESEQSGVYLVASLDGRRHIFVTGHSEYDPLTLKDEYDRDIGRGDVIDMPINYFPDNDVSKAPPCLWRSHANLLFSNWLNYCVYQETPYQL